MKAAHIIATSLLSLTIVACQKPNVNSTNASQDVNSSAGIVGGELMPSDSPIAKHIVALYAIDKKALCTGTLIAPNMVLTAAHCMGQQMVVAFGPDVKASFQDKSKLRPVTAATIHPKWNGNLRPEGNAGDVAVLKFAGTAPAGWVPAQILTRSDAIQRFTIIKQAGYGVNAPLAKESGSGVLRQTQTTVLDPMSTETEVTVNQREGHGVCFGDSGGPSFVNVSGTYYFWGVASAVSSPTKELVCKDKGIYTKVLSYISWIREQQRLLALRGN
jgi:secreted trypsin-like serine protease